MPQSYKWLLPWAVSLSACTVVNTRARAGDFSTGIIIWRKMPCLQNQNFPWGNAWFCCFPPSLPFTPSHTGTVTSEFFNFVFLRKKAGLLLVFVFDFRKLHACAWKCHTAAGNALHKHYCSRSTVKAGNAGAVTGNGHGSVVPGAHTARSHLVARLLCQQDALIRASKSSLGLSEKALTWSLCIYGHRLNGAKSFNSLAFLKGWLLQC